MSSKTIGDFATIKGGYAYKSKDFQNNGYPVLKIKNIGFGSIRYSDFSYVSKDIMEQTKSFQTSEGDILISMTGSNINQPESIVGRVAIVSKYDMPFLINQRVGKVEVKDSKRINSKYLYYNLSLKDSQYYLASNATGSANQVNINAKLIESLKIRDVTYEESNKIVHILSTLDDKIELNKKINQTLESIAQAMFKSWFVDFDPVHAKANAKSVDEYDAIAKELGISREILDLFPSEFEESELGLIPKGWRIVHISEIGEIVCGKTPSTKKPEYYGDVIPFITIPDMHGKIFQHVTNRYLSHLGAEVQKNKTIPPHSICVSCIATPGLVSITTMASQTNQQINSVIPNNQNEVFFWYLVLRGLADEIRSAGSGGSVFLNLSKTRFERLRIISPPQELRNLFNEKSNDLFNIISCHDKEIITLANLRDILLPKLLSGEIDASNLNLEPEND